MGFQILTPLNEVREWIIETFGEEYLLNQRERGMRVVEEALELGQSLNLTKEEAHALVEQVFAKPKDEDVGKEAAGTFVCLLAACIASNTDLVQAYMKERDRRWRDKDLINKRHFTKPVREL